jgi:hypothetical protein
MRIWAVVLSVALVASALAAGGCGDSTTIKGSDGTEITTNNNEGKLADGFPANIPVYKGTIVDSGSLTVNGASTWTASIETADRVDDIKAFYKDGLAAEGWTVTSEIDQNDTSGGRLVAYQAENGNSTLTVSISLLDGKTTIALMAGTK